MRPFRSQCACACHHTPGMLHAAPCCIPDEPSNQTTDEAAVDKWSDENMLRAIAKDCDRWPCNSTSDGAPSSADTLRDIAGRIETLRAQLTAATRRAEQAERDAADRKTEAGQWQAKGFEHEAKLERAERRLAEVDAMFNENINKQADRLGISPDKVESPGQWMMRVRRAAIRALKEQQP